MLPGPAVSLVFYFPHRFASSLSWIFAWLPKFYLPTCLQDWCRWRVQGSFNIIKAFGTFCTPKYICPKNPIITISKDCNDLIPEETCHKRKVADFSIWKCYLSDLCLQYFKWLTQNKYAGKDFWFPCSLYLSHVSHFKVLMTLGQHARQYTHIFPKNNQQWLPCMSLL